MVDWMEVAIEDRITSASDKDIGKIVMMFNRFCDEERIDDCFIYDFSDYEAFFNNLGWEKYDIAVACINGKVNLSHEYIVIDAYNHFQSIHKWDIPAFITPHADFFEWLEKNLHHDRLVFDFFGDILLGLDEEEKEEDN